MKRKEINTLGMSLGRLCRRVKHCRDLSGRKVRFLHLVFKGSVPNLSNHGYTHPKTVMTVTQHSIPNLERTLWDNFANQIAM